MGYGRGKLAHFRRGKLAHLFSMNKHFQESVQYFIAFSDYISHILIPKPKDLLKKNKNNNNEKKKKKKEKNVFMVITIYIFVNPTI